MRRVVQKKDSKILPVTEWDGVDRWHYYNEEPSIFEGIRRSSKHGAQVEQYEFLYHVG